MKNKILSVLLALTLIMGLMPTISFGAAVDGSVVFYNAATNEQIADFDAESSIFAKVNFIAPKTGTANIVVANYNGKSLVGCNPIATLDMTAGEEVSYTTATISAKNSNKIKVFAWDGMGTMEPLINNPGEIKLAVPNVGGGSGAEVGGDVVSEEVNLTDGNVSAQVPEGVQLANGATALVLSTQTLSESASDIEAGENEELQSIDIHIDGVSSENNVPIIVTVDNFAQEGFNKGNISLYHVEADGTKEMTEVSSLDELTAHNTYTYNPETGTLTMALASFSEIALLSDKEKAWEGKYDYSWYNTTDTSFKISNADQLAAFGAIVGGMNEQKKDSFSGKTITLTSDINLADIEAENDANKIFYPIGYYNNSGSYEKTAGGEVTSNVSSFEGTFDGNGHTISNFYQNTWEMFGDYNDGYSGTPNHYKDAMGLFGYVVNGTVKNLTVDNFSSDGEFTPTGVIAAYAVNSEFSNIAITNCNPRVYNTGNGGIVGIGGNSDDPDTYKLTFNNITIDNSNKITALWGSWDVACGGLVGMFRGDGHAYMTNCNVAAQIDVYNDVCGNYQYYWYRYSGMMIGTNKNMTTDDDGYTVPETSKFHATNCTVHFGDWNDYYYCELVANSLASYTHDHQFSRLTQVDSIDVANMTITVDGKTTAIPTSGRCNYVVVDGEASTENATCYHFVDGAVWNHEDAGTETVDVDGDGVKETVLKEDRQHYYLPFNQLFTGYGWGVKHIPIYDDGTTEFKGVTILDRAAASNKKFEAVENVQTTFTTGETVTVGKLFSSNDTTIDTANVQVFVSPVDNTSTAGAAYVANTDDWTQGTLTFSGTGAATVTITDYYFCTPTTITITVSEVVVEQPVEKFEAQEVNLTHNLTTIESGYSITLGELFKAKDGAEIVNATVSTEVTGTATVNVNKDDWTQSEVVLNGTDAITITITDGELCIPASVTITMNEPEAVKKFEAVKDYKYVAGAEIALSNVFTAKSDYEDKINSATVEVTVNGAEFKYTEDTDNWTNGTLVFNEPAEDVTVTITDKNYCIETTNTINVVETNSFKTVFKNTAKYLYRVGNQNAITLSSLFEETTDEPSINGDVTVSAVSVIDDTTVNVNYTSNETWNKGTIKFDTTFTGPVAVTIDALGANPYTLYLEVVDATNITSAKGTTSGGNFALLCDVNTADYVYYWDSTLYGNGFTYSLNGAPTSYSSSHGHGVLMTKNATLDNVVIVGDVYDEYGAYTTNNDYNAAIDVMGETLIRNCYISGCSAPVSTRANANIVNTTLYGGAVGNLIIKGGTVTLEDVTTANYNDGRKAPIGMGIVIHSDATEASKLILNGTLTQYNFVNEEDTPTDTYAQKLHEAMFDDSCSGFHFETRPNRRVNTGIISLTTTFDNNDITDNANTGYSGQAVSTNGINGYVYTQPNTSGSVNNEYDKASDPHVATTYGAVLPNPVFDYTDKNYVEKVDGSNDYCYEENGTVYISMDDGDTFDWDTSILSVAKVGNNLDYTVTMNGTDYTGKSITFNTAGDYKVVYTYTDPYNYKLNGDGEITTYSEDYTETVNISVAVIKPETKHAEFTMGSSNTATEKITVDGTTTYISATGVTADNSTWTYITIDGQKIYYPIVAAKLTSTKGSSSYAYFPVFENVITITDYADNGTGDAVTYNSSTTTLPSNLSAVKGVYKAASDVPYWYNLTNSNLTQSGASEIFKWASSSDAPSDPETYNNVLCYKSPAVSKDRVEYITLVQYSYQDNAGTTYYYYVGYTLKAFTYQACVTPDTLVTLSDGTQKRIDELTFDDKLLAWDFFAGEYVEKEIALLVNHGEDLYKIANMEFSDGTQLKIIGDHGVFDYDLNKYVYISAENVAEYIGHRFVQYKPDGDYDVISMVNGYVTEEYTGSFSITSSGTSNAFASNILTVAPPNDFYNWIEMGDKLRYDVDKFEEDVKQYGLYTYEDFKDYVTYEQFTDWNGAYLKIPVEKGLFTFEYIIQLIELYSMYMPVLEENN